MSLPISVKVARIATFSPMGSVGEVDITVVSVFKELAGYAVFVIEIFDDLIAVRGSSSEPFTAEALDHDFGDYEPEDDFHDSAKGF